MSRSYDSTRVRTLIIGGGQAGLSVGYRLAERGLPFLIVDANRRIGDAWRHRWDSLRLFSPARQDGLSGLTFPGRGDAYPTKDEMADYLESYAECFQLPVRTGIRVDGLSKLGDRFVATAGGLRFESDFVVVAMADYQTPRVPAFARDLDSGIIQLHSYRYRKPSQLQDGGVLIVGAGNSGADIALEVARAHPTWLSGKESGHLPFRIDSIAWRFVAARLWRFIIHHVLTVNTPIGQRLRPRLLARGSPLIRVKPKDLIDAGIARVPRVVGVRDGRPLLANDETLDVKNVVWCTGYDPGFGWIHLPIFGEDGRPVNSRGVVTRVPGIYFVGLNFLYAMSSATITGVGRDAEHVADAIELQTRVRTSWTEPLRSAEVA